MCLTSFMNPAADPADVAALKARLAATQAALAAAEATVAERDAALAEMAEANRRLEQMIAELRREKFGPRSEKLTPDQYNLPLEDVEIAQGILQAAQEKADATLKASRSKGERVKRNRKPLPPGLPEIERVIEPASTLCPCGCGQMARIGEAEEDKKTVRWTVFPTMVPAARPSSGEQSTGLLADPRRSRRSFGCW